jgi:integrase
VLAAGVPVHVAQRLMRHANPETTLRWYARATEGDLAEALDGVFA